MYIRRFLKSVCIVQFQKNPYPPHGRSSEIPRGRGILKAKILEAKYEAKLEFPRGGGGEGVQKKIMGRVWIFSGTVQHMHLLTEWESQTGKYLA